MLMHVTPTRTAKAAAMTRPAATAPLRPHLLPVSLRLPVRPFDIQAALSVALGADWIVQREIDPDAEVSILAMAADDMDDTLPTFMLYERNGLVQVASVQDDAWQSHGGFANAHAAVAAIVAAIARLPGTPPTI